MAMTPTLLAPLAIVEFLNGGRLWFLLLVPLLALLYVMLLRRGDRASDTVRLVLPKQRPWVRHLAVILALTSLMALTFAWARPKQEVPEKRERATIVLTIDVSLSMQATDVKPNRLVAAKQQASEFIGELPEGYNVALVSFARSAQVVVPPTTDRASVLSAIDGLELQPSTAIGEGIHASLNALDRIPPSASGDEQVPARIVLLSDGSTTIGRPAVQAAKVADQRKVPIYTIAYGTPEGVVTINGSSEKVPVDERELADVAKASHGKAYSAKSAGQLKEAYADIASSVGYVLVDKEVTSLYAGVGLVFAILASVGMVSLGARWP